MSIQALPTTYRGVTFRSRLEARWAIFFDALQISWQYEPEGFEGLNGCKYLPDFFLPELNHRADKDKGLWIEVKGSDDALGRDAEKIASAIDYDATPISQGLLILGDVPHVAERWGRLVTHTGLYCAEHVNAANVAFDTLDSGQAYVDWHPRTFWQPKDDCASEGLPSMASTQAIVWEMSLTYKGERLAPKMSESLFKAYAEARAKRFA